MVDDLTIAGNFPTARTQRRPSKSKKKKRMRKNRNGAHDEKEVAKYGNVTGQRERGFRGRVFPLFFFFFGSSQIFRDVRSSTIGLRKNPVLRWAAGASFCSFARHHFVPFLLSLRELCRHVDPGWKSPRWLLGVHGNGREPPLPRWHSWNCNRTECYL